MALKLKISHKGLILVSVPLIFELLFVAILVRQVNDAEYEVQEERRNGAIVSHMNNLSRFGLDATVALVNYKSSRDAAKIAEFDRQVEHGLAEFGQLEALVNNAQDRAAVEKLEKDIRAVAAVLDKCKVELAAGDRLTALRFGPILIALGRQVNDTFALLVGPYRQKQEEALAAHDQARTQMKRVLFVGILANVLVAFMLALFFTKSIARRLKVLSQNSSRLAEGLPLNEPVGGRDEITGLDEAFHKMARELAEAMSELKASEERTRQVIDHMPVGVVTVDSAGRVDSSNPRTVEIFAMDGRAIVGRPVLDILPGLAGDSKECFYADKLESLIGKTFEAKGKRAGGENFPTEVSINKFITLEGNRYLVAIQDVTERHEIEKLKQEFVAMVSHDLRTPLTAVMGTLSLIEDGAYGDLSHRGVSRVQTAEKEIERLIGLINDLLDIEKMEAGKLTMTAELVDIAQIIERSIESVRGFAEQYKVSLQFDNISVKIMADSDRLVQVLVNLLSNAVKFSPPHSPVAVKTILIPGFVEVQVIDKGRGVPAEYRTAIFERFKQVRATDGARSKGTGLGLPICKAIVEAHGGQIGVRSGQKVAGDKSAASETDLPRQDGLVGEKNLASEDGVGSIFWIRLPV